MSLFALLVSLSLGAVTARAAQLPVPEGYLPFERSACRFVVPQRNAAIVDELAPTCVEALPRIRRQLGLDDNEGAAALAEVRVVVDPADLTTVAPPGSSLPRWSGAVAFPEHALIVLALRNRAGAPVEELPIVLEHELAHLALKQALGPGARVPRWFSEGLAVQQSEGSSFRRSGVLWWAALGGELLPLSSIEGYPEAAGTANLAYAQAADFVGLLLRREGWMGVRAVLRRLAAGEPFDAAFEFAYRRSVGELERAWRAGLAGSPRWVIQVTGSGALWGAITMLFVLAYLAVRRRRRRRIAEMADEEAPLERLIGVIEELEKTAPDPRIRDVAARSSKAPKTKVVIDGEIHTLH